MIDGNIEHTKYFMDGMNRHGLCVMAFYFSDYADYYPKHPLAPSVDKIDDKKDYTIDNIVICCRLANFGRNVYPFEPFQTVIDIVTHKTKVNNLDDFYND